MKRLLAAFALVTAALPQTSKPHRSPKNPLIREEQTIRIKGQLETWRLQWAKPPREECAPSDMSLTCPCDGFAYGEKGDLYLIRLISGREVERLHLTPLFGETPATPDALVQRWPVDYQEDSNLGDELRATAKKRPEVRVMKFADYDHDGRATEFYLPVQVTACGHQQGVVIGVSTAEPHLHALGTASHPEKPLYLQSFQWDALRDAKTQPLSVKAWPCGDHGMETEISLHLTWYSRGIDGTQEEFSCPEKGETRKLLRQVPLADAEQ